MSKLVNAMPHLRRAYRLMRARFGHQHWWPGETPFEVCVGAILTQNTAWLNVERAIANLKAAQVLEPGKLFALPEPKLAELIRPAGYFNVKARRLRAFLRVLVKEYGGDLDRLFAGETAAVRERLLAIHGVGPETADSLLLYAGGHHSFVIDAYTKRIFQRHNWSPKSKVSSPKPSASYDELKALCESALDQKQGTARLDYWQDYHAQLVMVGKHYCRTRAPRCDECPLKPLLPPPKLSPKAKLPACFCRVSR
jgi:endonuclease-3 related protein